MDGPGVYVPDQTEGIGSDRGFARSEDQTSFPACIRKQPCPQCGHASYRDKEFTRTLHDLGDLAANRPLDLRGALFPALLLEVSDQYFNADLTDWADPGSQYTRRVVHLAVRLVVEDGLPYRTASWHLWRDHRVFVPWATIQNWVEAAGKKSGTPRRRGVPRRRPGRLLAATSPPTNCTTALLCPVARGQPHLPTTGLRGPGSRPDPPRHHPLSCGASARELDRRNLTLRGDHHRWFGACTRNPWPRSFRAFPHQVCEFHILRRSTAKSSKPWPPCDGNSSRPCPQGHRGRPAAGAAQQGRPQKADESRPRSRPCSSIAICSSSIR